MYLESLPSLIPLKSHSDAVVCQKSGQNVVIRVSDVPDPADITPTPTAEGTQATTLQGISSSVRLEPKQRYQRRDFDPGTDCRRCVDIGHSAEVHHPGGPPCRNTVHDCEVSAGRHTLCDDTGCDSKRQTVRRRHCPISLGPVLHDLDRSHFLNHFGLHLREQEPL
ncbi:hypothetical protein RQP46_011463 [Phenoliferia psychrophenolica]